jgi:chromosome segregation ATPase
LRDALSAAETQRRDHEASVSESARAKTQRDGYETQIERLTTRLASVELRCVSALAEVANAKGTLEAQRVAFATERDAEIVTLRRRATGFQETQATLRRALANAESALVTATARALRAEAQSADVMTKSVEVRLRAVPESRAVCPYATLTLSFIHLRCWKMRGNG